MEGKENSFFLCRDINILVCGENGDDRALICELLSGFGVFTDEAEESHTACKLIREHSYDMVFLLIKDDGSRAAQILDSLLSGISGDMPRPFVAAVSKKDDEILRKRYLEGGFGGFLLMPLSREAVGSFLNQQIPEDKRRYLKEEKENEELQDVDVVKLFMAGVDVVNAITQNGGISDYLELLDVFLTDGQTREGSLRDKIAKEDYVNYVIEVHGLKSAAANIGAMHLSELAKKHEAAGNASDFTYIQKQQEELFACYADILAEIKRVLMSLEYGKFAKRDDSKLQAIEGGELKEKIAAIVENLEDFESKEAAKGVEELLGCKLDDAVRTELESVKTMLKMYEDDDAEDKLKELLDTL